MKKDKKQFVITLLFWLYLAAVLRITVFRNEIIQGNFFAGRFNFRLFKAYVPIIQKRNWWYFCYLFIGNIIWFVPFGMYLEYRGKCKKLWHAFFYGFLFSFTIEALQYIFGTGITELDDLVLNTLGAVLGCILIRIIKKKKGAVKAQA